MGYIEKVRDSLSFRGNIPGLFISSVIESSAWHMYQIVWQPYMMTLGGSTPLIGFILSVWTAVNALAQLVTGELCDSIGRKKVLTAYYIFSIAGLIIAAVAQSWIYFIAVNILFGLADALGEPAFNPIFAESVPKEKIAIAMSLLTLTWSLPGFYSKALGGYFGDLIGGKSVIYIVIVVEIISLTWFYLTVKETLTETKPFKLRAVLRNIQGISKPNQKLVNFYAVAILDRFGWMITSGILVAIFTEAFNFTLTQIGLLLTLEMIAITLTSIPAGKALDRYGPKKGITVALLINAFSFLGYAMASSFSGFAILQVFKGVCIGIWDPGFTSYLSKIIPENERGKNFGNINSIRGLVSIPAPFIGALLFKYIGFRGLFLVSTFFVVASFLASLRLPNPLDE